VIFPTPITAALGLLAKLPWWFWVVGGLAGWGAWNGYRAKAVKADFEKAKVEAQVERAEGERLAAVESARRTKVHQEITDAEVIRRTAAEAVAARLLAADQRLRLQSAAQIASAVRDSQAAGGGAAAAETSRVFSELFGECRDRVRVLVKEADGTRAAGVNCERAYDALKGVAK